MSLSLPFLVNSVVISRRFMRFFVSAGALVLVFKVAGVTRSFEHLTLEISVSQGLLGDRINEVLSLCAQGTSWVVGHPMVNNIPSSFRESTGNTDVGYQPCLAEHVAIEKNCRWPHGWTAVRHELKILLYKSSCLPSHKSNTGAT